ncbi:MAG: DUF1343 domain-containing protein [Armatimonadetes bacterium]|nr:DUF1343 domain-containing protein [Armatimonadota bacterium]
MSTQTGLDLCLQNGFSTLQNDALGWVCNQASISRRYRHGIDELKDAEKKGQVKVAAVFGPEHGLFGHTQDNMIEWEGAVDPRYGWPIHSLYGTHREPQDFMMRGVERMVIDLPDVGSRYYTFIWTMALCMKACVRLGVPMTVLDRPNPINGITVEGNLLRQEFDSFVGLYPLPTRHGLTIGEVATYLHQTQFPGLDLTVVKMMGWDRSMYFEETGLPWAVPSPNMPTVDCAVVYPGGCILEATNVSEGRGTTRPFEIMGAPWIDGWELADALNGLGLPGCVFRPLPFEPTFNKFARELCGGVFLHVTDRSTYESTLTMVAILQQIRRLYGDKLVWRDGPYEYEYQKRPIDILAGDTWFTEAVDNLWPLAQVKERFLAECAEFEPTRQACLLY